MYLSHVANSYMCENRFSSVGDMLLIVERLAAVQSKNQGSLGRNEQAGDSSCLHEAMQRRVLK